MIISAKEALEISNYFHGYIQKINNEILEMAKTGNTSMFFYVDQKTAKLIFEKLKELGYDVSFIANNELFISWRDV